LLAIDFDHFKQINDLGRTPVSATAC